MLPFRSSMEGERLHAQRLTPPMTGPDQHDAFLRELQAHKAILYKVANAYCARREDRGDLIQDITIELFTAYPKFDARVASFSTWMYRIAMNVAISAHRGDGRRIRDALSIDEFGMDLAAADQVLTMEETLLLKRVARGLGLSDQEYQVSQERHRERLSVIKLV